jgi:hypothetical protein
MSTNGIDAARVLTALARVGWDQPTESGYPVLTSANTTSISGRKYNGGAYHSALTIQNIKDCQPNPLISDADFNTFLSNRRDEMLLSMLNIVFGNTQYLDSGLLFEKSGKDLHTVGNSNGFVGVQIKMSQGDYSARIDNAELLFDGNATFKLYLYHDKKGKLQEKEVTVTANTMITEAIGWELSYRNASIKGGTYFVGYFQSDLGDVKAIDYDYCSNGYITFGSANFIAPKTGALTFDFENISTGTTMYGLNLEMSGYRDMTQQIVQNAHAFDELQGLMMAANVIDLIINSDRITSNQRIAEASLHKWRLDLKGYKDPNTETYYPGLEQRIAKEAKRVAASFQQKKKTIVTSPTWNS